MLFRPTDRQTDRPTHQTIRSTQHGIFECTHAYPSGLCKTKLRIPLENEGAATRMHRARYMSSFRTTASNDYQVARYTHVHAIQSDIHHMYQQALSPLNRSLRAYSGGVLETNDAMYTGSYECKYVMGGGWEMYIHLIERIRNGTRTQRQ